jgi:hypothetical protein
MRPQSRPIVIAPTHVAADLQIGSPNKTRKRHSYDYSPVASLDIKKTARTRLGRVSINTTPSSRR